MASQLAELVREVADEDEGRAGPLQDEEEDPEEDELGDVLHARATENRPRTEMHTVILCDTAADPTA